MITHTIYFLIFITSLTGFAQDYSDYESMKTQSYMQNNFDPNCDSLDGNNAQHKICLNLEFQNIDSMMNKKYIEYLSTVKIDSVKLNIINFQNAWVKNRKKQSQLKALDYKGHISSIYYISSMCFITKKRLEELEFLIDDRLIISSH